MNLLISAVILALLVGAFQLGETVEDALRTGRNVIRKHPVSGDIAVIAIDDKSLSRLNRWPWPRRNHAKLAENLHKLGAKRIFFDIDFSAHSNPEDDRILEQTFASLDRKVTLASLFMIDPVTGERTDMLPLPRLRKHVELANINLRFTYAGVVWDLPYAMTLKGKSYPSIASSLSGVSGPDGELFLIDHALDPRSVPTISAADVVEGKVAPEQIAGKDVIIGAASMQLGDVFKAPGYGLISGVYLHVLGAETLKSGIPVAIGWVLPFLAALALTGAVLTLRSAHAVIGALSGAFLAFLAAPFLLEHNRIYADVVPSLTLLLIVGGALGWKAVREAFRKRASINAVSGLPNLNALRESDVTGGRLIAARVQNFAEITAALQSEQEKSLVDQIARRLTVGAPETHLYQGDEGIFVWFEQGGEAAMGDHLDALHGLFRTPIKAGDNQFDLSVTFGVEVSTDRSLTNRLGSALVAADEAAAAGLRWKSYDPAKLKDAAWKLSLLSQLDAAIDAGDLWIAYQPKLDLKDNRIIGAEALVRWTHPEKGPISPIEFVGAAEQSDRIDRLTNHVLEGAIRSAASVNCEGTSFDIAVNLSARLIGDPKLVTTISALLDKHGLQPERLILEVTETAAMTTGTIQFEMLEQIRALGVRISIDDYGTGLSTLEYVRRIPASEIKIDRSFVQALGKNQGDRIMVHSTIQLAHSLGRKVVAEGIEDQSTLDELKRMGCDIGQGYLIGKPMPFGDLLQQLQEEGDRVAA